MKNTSKTDKVMWQIFKNVAKVHDKNLKKETKLCEKHLKKRQSYVTNIWKIKSIELWVFNYIKENSFGWKVTVSGAIRKRWRWRRRRWQWQTTWVWIWCQMDGTLSVCLSVHRVLVRVKEGWTHFTTNRKSIRWVPEMLYRKCNWGRRHKTS